MLTVGIDPGKEGCIAYVDSDTMRFEGHDIMPLDDEGDWDPELMNRLVASWCVRGVHNVVIEQVHAFPGPQAYASSVTMFGYGMWLGVLHAHGYPVTTVRSEVWKREMSLLVPIAKAGKKATAKEKAIAYRKRKEKAVARAEQLFPGVDFITKKGRLLDGKAEAALLAYWLERGCVGVNVAQAAA